MVIEELFSGCLSVLACLRFNIHTLYYCVKKLNYKLFLPQVSSWVPFYRGSTRRWGHNDVKCRFGSYSIHKPNSRTRVLVLEVQVLFYQDNKNLSQNSWHRLQNLACGGATIEKVWSVHYHELSTPNKFPNYLEIFPVEVIYPTVRHKN